MNERNRKLGVCIPTYKRPDQLLKCAGSIIAAAEPHAVPIYILDDSADETNAGAIRELQARYPHIVYRKNERNLGIDRNIVASVDACECEYAWIMGEDDRMKPDAVRIALAALETAPAFVCVNYAYVDDAVSVILRERQLDIADDLILSGEEFARTHAWAIGFIGSCIVSKECWNAVDTARYVGTYFAHAGSILESLRHRPVTVIAKPLVLNRVGGAETFTWSDDAYGVFTGWDKMVERLDPIYGPELRAALVKTFHDGHGLNTLRFLCGKRADNIYNMEIYRRFIRPGAYQADYKATAWLIAAMRPGVFKLLQKALGDIRRGRNRKVVLS